MVSLGSAESKQCSIDFDVDMDTTSDRRENPPACDVAAADDLAFRFLTVFPVIGVKRTD